MQRLILQLRRPFAGRWLALLALVPGTGVWAGFAASPKPDTNAPVERVEGICRFILHRYPLAKADGQKINLIVHDLLKRQSEAFGIQPPADLRIHIRMFGRFEDFGQFTRTNHLMSGDEHGAGSISNLAGYYSPRTDEVVTWRQKDPSYLANNILHECSHAISQSQFRFLPKWLNEGCAVYFSFPRNLRDQSDDLSLAARWQRLKQWREDRSLPAVRAFVDQTAAEFVKLPVERSYIVSWSLFQLLMSTPENRTIMNTMLRRQQRRRDFAPCSELLDELYPGGVATLEKDWHAWIARGAASVLPKPEKTR